MVSIDRRYQVFISSTFRDLAEQRKQTIQVVHELGHIPIALESFHPSNKNDLETISSVMEDCQIYILILGHRYGAIVPHKEISFTELEYDLAREKGLMILPLALDSKEIDERRKELSSDNTIDREELKHYKKLKDFHSKIGEFKQIWKSGDQFQYLVAKTISFNLPKCELPGFIPEEQKLASKTLVSAAQNEFIIDTVSQLEGFKKLHTRCSQEEPLKRQLAKFFVEQYGGRIVKHRVSLFLESGSTVAYVARELGTILSRSVKMEEGSPTINVSTNNVLAYLQFWLTSRIPCTTFPWGPPSEETYGALYGELEHLSERQPTYDLTPLDDEAKEEIRKLCKAPFGPLAMQKPGLLLGAASGLQLAPCENVDFPDNLEEKRKENLLNKLKQCYGPHIASYRNKIFKRYMYATELPLIIFLTENKINSTVRVGESHFVLDEELLWDSFKVNHPLAFCVSCNRDNQESMMNHFTQQGFDLITGHNYSAYVAFMARNQKFIDMFESKTAFSP